MSPAAANRDVYDLLKDGIQISVPDHEHGGQKTERVTVVDWRNPAANDFLLVSQMTITGALYTTRPDLLDFVNGLPLVVVELKKPGALARPRLFTPDVYQQKCGVIFEHIFEGFRDGTGRGNSSSPMS